MKRLIFLRKASQTFFSLAFIYILWSAAYPLRSRIGPVLLFRLDPLITFLTSISARTLIGGLAYSLGMIIATVILGRFFCGWMCPLGASIDMAGSLGSRRPSFSEGAQRRLAIPKFIILGIILIYSFRGIQVAWMLDPTVIVSRFISLILNPNPYYFSHSVIILMFFLAVAGSAFFIRRLWCRAICPLGALYALFARYAMLGRVVRNCRDCRICKSDCRMGAIKDDAGYTKGECVLCMDCVYNCPEHAARFSFSSQPTAKG